MNPHPLNLVEFNQIALDCFIWFVCISQKLELIRFNPNFKLVMLIHPHSLQIELSLKFFVNQSAENILELYKYIRQFFFII